MCSLYMEKIIKEHCLFLKDTVQCTILSYNILINYLSDEYYNGVNMADFDKIRHI